MESARVKPPCITCNKAIGITTCGGCQQWFCAKHFNEHRQSLGQEMERIGRKHDHLYKNLAVKNDVHPLFAQINNWEKESIKKIQAVAGKARSELAKYLNETKFQLQESLTKIKDELAASRASDDYTEIDLTGWSDQLQILRQMLEKPSSIDIIEDDQSQPFIRVVQQKGSHSLTNYYNFYLFALVPFYLLATVTLNY